MGLLREALLLLYLWCLPYQPLLRGPLLLQCGARCGGKALHAGAGRSWVLCCQPGSLSPGLRPTVGTCPSPPNCIGGALGAGVLYASVSMGAAGYLPWLAEWWEQRSDSCSGRDL